jgi:aminopeptidase N
LEFFGYYFWIPYPLPKMDMVAVPEFPGGMENWGLVRYKHITLLLDKKTSSAANKKRVAEGHDIPSSSLS